MRIKLALTIEIGHPPQPVDPPVDQGTTSSYPVEADPDRQFGLST